MTYPPGVLDQYFKWSGDNVQNIEVNCVKCDTRKLPLIYFDTYNERRIFVGTDVVVVHTISEMLYSMNQHIAKVHLEEVR